MKPFLFGAMTKIDTEQTLEHLRLFTMDGFYTGCKRPTVLPLLE